MTHDHHGRIGPNAIIRIAEAITAHKDYSNTIEIFTAAGLSHYIERKPEEMVDEGEVSRLHAVLRNQLGLQEAAAISSIAGQKTGKYLLKHRIPSAAQRLLRLLPPGPSARILLKAIDEHSWTFCGSGIFSYQIGHPLILSITGCPICREGHNHSTPLCDYYTATFATIFSALVSPHSQVNETACQASGATACRFDIVWK